MNSNKSLYLVIIITALILFLLSTFFDNLNKENFINNSKAIAMQTGEERAVKQEVYNFIKNTKWEDLYSRQSEAMFALFLTDIQNSNFKLMMYHQTISDKYYLFRIINENNQSTVIFDNYLLKDEPSVPSSYEENYETLLTYIDQLPFTTITGYCSDTEQVQILEDKQLPEKKYLLYTTPSSKLSYLMELKGKEDYSIDAEFIGFFNRDERGY